MWQRPYFLLTLSGVEADFFFLHARAHLFLHFLHLLCLKVSSGCLSLHLPHTRVFEPPNSTVIASMVHKSAMLRSTRDVSLPHLQSDGTT